MKIYVVSLYLSKKIPTGFLGFSDLVFRFVFAETQEIALEKAKDSFSHRSDLTILKMSAWEAKDQNLSNYLDLDGVIK